MADDDTRNRKIPKQSENGLQWKVSRKEERRKLRSAKKARKKAYFSITKSEPEIKANKKLSEKKEGQNFKQKKKKKRKKTNETENREYLSKSRKICIYDENDDIEIEELEKKLKLNKKSKIPDVFYDDGLGDILNVCNAIESGNLKSQVESQDEGLNIDSIEFAGVNVADEISVSAVSADMNENDTIGEAGGCYEESDDESNAESGDDNVGLQYAHESGDETEDDSDELDQHCEDIETGDVTSYDVTDSNKINKEHDEIGIKKKRKEDIYGGATAKYIPPQQRDNPNESTINNERLRKQVKGLLNRLSESNLSTVSCQLEKLFMSNSRNDLNEIISDLLMKACVSATAMPEGLLREHIMIITILNSLVGSEVGAYLLQKLVSKFHQLHCDKTQLNESKELDNVVTLLAFLYCFKVIDCQLIYDIFRKLVNSFQEKDIELLLLLIRHVGVEIRRENPESLKEIILEIQTKSASSADACNSRTRFMLETINALRNNNIRKIPNYDPGPVDRARKILRSIAGSIENEKLSISMNDILDAEKKGRWWIVGSAWSEREKLDSVSGSNPMTSYHSDIIEISRQQRMNTDVRRNIFCTVMTSEDYVDAFENLLRLKLKEKQCREIIHVLMDCSLQEKSYNPFYSYLIQKFCEFSRSFQVTVQYSLWDRFKMGTTLTEQNFSNMAQLLVHLLVNKALSLSILKVVDFTTLDSKLVQFFTDMLRHLLLDYPESMIRNVFSRIAPLDNMDALRESLKLFMKHFLKPQKSRSIAEAKNKIARLTRTSKLEERISVAIVALSTIN